MQAYILAVLISAVRATTNPTSWTFTSNVTGMNYPTSNTIDKGLAALSIGPIDFMTYFGNSTLGVNTFSQNLVANLGLFTDSDVYIRLGSGFDGFLYDASITIPYVDSQGYYHYGPSYYEAVDGLPSNAKVMFGINLLNSITDGIQVGLSQAASTVEYVGDKLYGFSLGNEADKWDRVSLTGAEFVSDWTTAQKAISSEVLANTSYPTRFFQAGNIASSTSVGYQITDQIADGIDTEAIEEFAMNAYVLCDCTHSTPQLDGITAIMSYTNLITRLGGLIKVAAPVNAVGAEYVLGETNSACCGGDPGISDVFASAIWALSWGLHLATFDISKVYYHQSIGANYALWDPVKKITNPVYYGVLALADVVGLKGDVKVVDLNLKYQYGNPDVVTYGIYSDDILASIVAINGAVKYSTETVASTPITLNVPTSYKTARILSLKAPGAEVDTNITWAGMSYSSGKGVVTDASGNQTVSISNGVLTYNLAASTAILIQLNEAVVAQSGTTLASASAVSRVASTAATAQTKTSTVKATGKTTSATAKTTAVATTSSTSSSSTTSALPSATTSSGSRLVRSYAMPALLVLSSLFISMF